jgi:diguanylate cyclase (GGDEF)-like protein
MEELTREVAVARRTAVPGAVLMLDLDRFKDINDSLGHVAGDNLLARVAEGLRRRLRSTDTLARLGGDEFAVVLPGCTPGEAREIGEQLLDAIGGGAGVRIAGRERRPSASVGIAPFGGSAEQDADGLLVEADLAMYRAKQEGAGRVEVFDEEMRAELAARVQIEGELREALDEKQLEVFYQPIVEMADGTPVGCEALVRWRHPRRGLTAPDQFVPVAEEHGLISRVGSHVLRKACLDARDWREAGHHAYVSVNVSPLQLVRGHMVREVSSILEETRLPAPLLCLEITETSLIDDAAMIAPALEEVRELGVRIAIDDFGGGTSSLSFLSILPIDIIKIDQLFVQSLARRRDDRAIVAAVISMAEELDLTVIAEGVEEELQHGELRELGCRLGQGYLYAKPGPVGSLSLDGYAAAGQPGVGDPSVIREFMRQIGIPAKVGGA